MICSVYAQMLEPGETILVDTDSVLCFESSVKIDVRTVGGFLTCCCSGEVRRKQCRRP